MPDVSDAAPDRITVRIDNPRPYLIGNPPRPVPADFSRVVRDDPKKPGAVLNAVVWRVEGGRRFEIHPREAHLGDYVLTGVDRLQTIMRAEQSDQEWTLDLDIARAYTFADLDALAATHGSSSASEGE